MLHSRRISSCIPLVASPLLLPCGGDLEAAVAEEKWLRVAHLAQGSSVSALLADDVLENREVLSQMLADIGVQITLAENGREAVEKVEAGAFDIVFLDIRMPVMDGVQAAQRIWARFGKDAFRVVAISASSLDHERKGYLDAGFDGFIPKPFRAGQVYACLADLLGVGFEYAEVPGAKEEPPLDLDGISLPEGLVHQLRQAAELSSVTELESILGDVEKLGDAEARLAAHLRALSQDFKMDEILEMLERVG